MPVRTKRRCANCRFWDTKAGWEPGWGQCLQANYVGCKIETMPAYILHANKEVLPFAIPERFYQHEDRFDVQVGTNEKFACIEWERNFYASN